MNWIRRYREIFKSALVIKNPSTKNFFLREVYNNNKTKSENTARADFARAINCTQKLN